MFWDEIGVLRDRWDVLRHPFYVEWSLGTLTRRDLALYAGEYYHAVVALADAAAGAAARAESRALRRQLADHANEERDHVDLFRHFLAALDARPTASPLRETRRCAEIWAGSKARPLLDSLVTLHVVEAAQPAISVSKADGLRRFYGFGESVGTVYFDLHAERDHAHAQMTRQIIDRRNSTANPKRLLKVAEQALRVNWGLLDGVQKALAV